MSGASTLLHLFGAGAVDLSSCDGRINLYDDDCQLEDLPTDLSFCRCQLCQVYQQRTGPSSGLDNSIMTTHLQAGMESEHELCLNHWTFFRISTHVPETKQMWFERDIDQNATISAALGSSPSTPQTLIVTLDTEYDEAADRFTTIDAFFHLSSTLPDNWFQVHHVEPGLLYPHSVFTDSTMLVEFKQQDSFTYTMGLDDGTPDCSAHLPEEAFYLAVRCAFKHVYY